MVLAASPLLFRFFALTIDGETAVSSLDILQEHFNFGYAVTEYKMTITSIEIVYHFLPEVKKLYLLQAGGEKISHHQSI